MHSWLGEAAGSATRCLLVAQVEGQVVGFIHGQLAGGPPPVLPRLDGEITDLYVAPASRRRGLARALVAALTAWFTAHGAGKIVLSAAVAFWQAQGFAPPHDPPVEAPGVGDSASEKIFRPQAGPSPSLAKGQDAPRCYE
jgi:GNAT superfamily N-acetyltransferase